MSKVSHTPHILPLKLYLGIGSLLLFLTAVTVWASYIDLGEFNIVLAMAIAAFKASLVILFFMHLLYDNKIYMFAFVLSIVMLAFLLAVTLFDTMKRAELYDIEDGPINARAKMYENLDANKGKH